MTDQHLWEVDHPYYATEGNYYAAGEHYRHGTWAEFIAEMGDMDADLNLLYRFDWRQMDDAPPGVGTLLLFYMAQRKARCFSCEVAVGPDDEATIREWLMPKWEKVRAIWAPFAGVLP